MNIDNSPAGIYRIIQVCVIIAGNFSAMYFHHVILIRWVHLIQSVLYMKINVSTKPYHTFRKLFIFDYVLVDRDGGQTESFASSLLVL